MGAGKSQSLRRMVWIAGTLVSCAPSASAPARPGGVPPKQGPADSGKGFHYPATRSEPIEDHLNGLRVPDPFRWLEARDEAVGRWTTEQDAFARRYLSALPEREAFEHSVRALLRIEELFLPTKAGGRYFYERRSPDQNRGVYYVLDRGARTPRVLLDPNVDTQIGGRAIANWWTSRTGKYVAFAVSEDASDDRTIHILDAASGKELSKDRLAGARFADIDWGAGDEGLYYAYFPSSSDNSSIFARSTIRYHRIGTSQDVDTTVVKETGDPNVEQHIRVSHDERWMFLIRSHGWGATDVYFRRLGKRDNAWRTIVEGASVKVTPVAWGDKFYLLTNYGAPSYRLLRSSPEKPALATAEEIIPARPPAVLSSFDVIGGRLALRWLEDAVSRVELANLDGSSVTPVELPGAGLVVGPYGTPDDDEAFFRYSSFVTPSHIFKLSARTGKTELFAKPKSDRDYGRYSLDVERYSLKDGGTAPLFVVRSKENNSAPAPLLLYAYGAHASSLDPSFLPHIFAWLDRGGIYVEAVVRGGGEYGEQWHRDGMLERKQNTIDDFVAAAEHLVSSGLTTPERLGAMGSSGGGLLVSAAITQRPELFGAAIVHVPLTDMVRYPQFGIGGRWLKEFGDPSEPAALRYLLGYSPYHHVQRGVRYPAVMVRTAENDDRVDPLHARKFVAALQTASTGGPVLLVVERNAGHQGADDKESFVERKADTYAFAWAQLAKAPSAVSSR